MRLFIAVALGMLATPAVAAEQFDLVCTSKDAAFHYRVDLTAGEWCFNECALVQKIANVTSGVLTLDDHQAQFSTDFSSSNAINRVTGEWRMTYYSPRQYPATNRTGSCVVAPFSGLGTSSRKF